jgi:5'-nucleotidase
MQNRRDFLKVMMLGGTFASLGLSPLKMLAKEEVTQLTILHTNDCHSHIEPFPADDPRNAGKGGFAERAALIKKIRKQIDNVLLFDAGDIFQGTPYFNFFNGELELKLMSGMNYDAATIGNHEFDNGLENIKTQLKHMSFPFISSNYDFRDTPLEGKIKKYKIFNKGDIKTGVFGLGIELEGLVNKNNYANTKYLDPIKTAQKTAKFLRQEHNCDFVICISHLGYKYRHGKVSDEVVAKNSGNIDLIIGGHTHTFLDKPVAFRNIEGKEVMVVQAGWGGLKLGQMNYFFEKSGKKKLGFASTINILKNQG